MEVSRRPDFAIALQFIGPNENTDSGRSAKYWCAEVYSNVFVRRWGRIGTTGSTMREKFESTYEAKRAAVKMAEEKKRKGYQKEIDIVQLIGSLGKDV